MPNPPPERCTDPQAIEVIFRRDPQVHLYGLADLDPSMWVVGTWWADRRAAVGVLRLDGIDTPVVYAQARAGDTAVDALVAALAQQLPDRFEGTFGPDVPAVLARWFDDGEVGLYDRMVLTDATRLAPPIDHVVLGVSDLAELLAFLATVPGTEAFVTPAMLATGHVIAVRNPSGAIVATAGVHVHSPEYGVTAIGNVATHPSVQGSKIARRLTSEVCRRVLDSTPLVGLNHRSDNEAARRAYEAIGFEAVHTFRQGVFVRR